jgi:DMSO/TMAO reductase YedYZ molybdopterin-dependent catalytic subunit
MSELDARGTPADPEGRTGTVTVEGASDRTFDVDALAGMEPIERCYTVACASGDRTTARWTGVPVPDLLDAVGVPPATTHLRLTGRDGYRVCVAVRDALDGLVAYARDGRPLAATEPYALRFLAGDAAGERLVRGLRRVEPLELAAGEDPDRLETVSPETTFG